MPQGSLRRARFIIISASLLGCGFLGALAIDFFRTPDVAAATLGELTVESDPAGVSVFVDGQARGATPVTVSLPPGEHALELRRGSEVRSRSFASVGGSRVSHFFEFRAVVPTSTTGVLQVSTDPANARVTLNGKAAGVSPVEIRDLEAGAYIVEVSKDQTRVQRKVKVQPGITSSLVIALSGRQGPSSGWLSVTSPVTLQLFEQDQLVGTSETPRIMLPTGRHELTFVNTATGFRGVKKLEIESGRMTPLRIDVPNGRISVNAQPWAEILIDGKAIGETPIGNLEVPIGTHKVTFKHPQLGERTQTVTVSLTAPTRIGVDLRK